MKSNISRIEVRVTNVQTVQYNFLLKLMVHNQRRVWDSRELIEKTPNLSESEEFWQVWADRLTDETVQWSTDDSLELLRRFAITCPRSSNYFSRHELGMKVTQFVAEKIGQAHRQIVQKLEIEKKDTPRCVY
ncbi:hypothetical protein GEMRC1_001318 [Eukaryota sp. GEM-RC1]